MLTTTLPTPETSSCCAGAGGIAANQREMSSAVGAVLAWAVHVSTSGFNVHTVGYILLAVGIVGGVLSMIFWSSWAGPGCFSRRRTYVDEGPAA
jgi:hypothetical protein